MVIITSIIATILVLFGRIQKPDRWLKIGFVLVTFLGCIHYNYGNDYVRGNKSKPIYVFDCIYEDGVIDVERWK